MPGAVPLFISSENTPKFFRSDLNFELPSKEFL
jgi:hypothetical protein